MDQFWFHCNGCGQKEKTTYKMTSCGHIICAQCHQAAPDNCTLCQAKNVKVMDIGSELFKNPDISSLFKHQSDEIRNLGRNWEIQMSQYKGLLKHLTEVKRQKLAELERGEQILRDVESELASKRAWKEQEEQKIQSRKMATVQGRLTRPTESTNLHRANHTDRPGSKTSTDNRSPYFNSFDQSFPSDPNQYRMT